MRVPFAAARLAAKILCMALLAPSAARAQGASIEAEIARVREQVLYAQYPEAIASGQALLARTDLDARQRNLVLEIVATAQIANRQPDAARATLETLYARDPGHRLSDPDASPPVISAFARAREARPTPVRLVLEHTSPGTLPRREPPLIEVRIAHGSDAVAEVRLAYRTEGEPWSQVVMNRREAGTWSGRIPVLGSAASAHDVAYYLVALAPSGAELGAVGSQAEPLQLRIPAEAPAPAARQLAERAPARPEPVASPVPGGGNLAEEPALWVILGLVVAGGIAAGVGIGIATQPSGPEQGTLGSVTLMH